MSIEKVMELEIGNVVPSATNPRKRFDEAALKEWAETIKAHGVLQPLLVRAAEMTKSQIPNTKFEIIAGERRWRASRIAGRQTVPCVVKELSDRDVLEIQYIENLARQDLTALEEAEGFAKLIADGGYTADTLAEKLGKSRSHIFGRLRLARLVGPAREALEAGELPMTIATLAAQLPGKELQGQFVKAVMKPQYSDEPLSFRQATELMEERFIRPLDGRFPVWDFNEEKMFKGAPSCAKCPARSWNIEGFEGAAKRPNVCTNVNCFAQKTEIATEREIKAAAAAGAEVLSAKQWDDWRTRDKYLKLDEKCYTAPHPHPTYGELVKKAGGLEALEIKRVLAVTSREGLCEVAPKQQLIESLREFGVLKKESGGGGRGAGGRSEAEKKAERERKIRTAATKEAMGQLVEALERKMDAANEYEFHRILCSAIVSEEVQIYDAYERAFGRRGLAPVKDGGFKNHRKPFAKHLDELTGPKLRGLLAELILGVRAYGDCNYTGGQGKAHFKQACEKFGVNLEKIEKTMRDAVAAQKGTKKTKGPGGEQTKVCATSAPAKVVRVVKKKVKRMSAAAREKIAAAQRARWAKAKKK